MGSLEQAKFGLEYFDCQKCQDAADKNARKDGAKKANFQSEILFVLAAVSKFF